MLTEEQINDFKRNGYLLIRGLYSPEEIHAIQQWTDEVANYPE